MKSRILLMVLFTIIARSGLYAQANCTSPYDCIYNWGTNSSSTMTAAALMGWDINGTSNTMLPDWSVLTGTPIYGPGMSATTGIQMVSDYTTGEGVYTCYNFIAGKSYKICLMAYNTTMTSGGNLILEAYNGTTAETISNQLFFSLPSSGFMEFSFSYTATQNSNQLRIYTNCNCTPTISNPYSVVFDDIGVVEVPVLTASPSTISGCGNSTLFVNSTSLWDITWSPSGSLSLPTGNSVIAKPCQTTTYTASYHSKHCFDGWNCPKTVQVTVNVQDGTSVTASPPTITGCQGSTLTASSTNAMAVTWSPSYGLSAVSGNVVIAKPCKTTTYTASFRCVQTGCTYTKQVTVFVQHTITGGIINNSDTIPCMDTIDMHFSSPCTNIASYSWVGPKGNILSTTSSVFMPTSLSTDEGEYKLIITSTQGCTDTFKTSVVMQGCCDIRADFNIVGCNPVRFVNTTTSNGVPVIQGEWYWDMGDGTNSTLRNPSHLYNTKMGPNTVCLTVVYQGLSTCCDKICKDFNICDFAPCDPRAAFDFIVMSPGIVQFLDKSAGSGTACGWTWKVDGVVRSSIQNPVITMSSGTHTICLEVTYCQMGGITCHEEWCEQIVIP